MEKVLAIIILLGRVKKGKTRDYCRTTKLIETQIFGRLMSKFGIFGVTVTIPPWTLKQTIQNQANFR
jgi:hypothetical protein